MVFEKHAQAPHKWAELEHYRKIYLEFLTPCHMERLRLVTEWQKDRISPNSFHRWKPTGFIRQLIDAGSKLFPRRGLAWLCGAYSGALTRRDQAQRRDKSRSPSRHIIPQGLV
jgi:hypothetical protein